MHCHKGHQAFLSLTLNIQVPDYRQLTLWWQSVPLFHWLSMLSSCWLSDWLLIFDLLPTGRWCNLLCNKTFKQLSPDGFRALDMFPLFLCNKPSIVVSGLEIVFLWLTMYVICLGDFLWGEKRDSQTSTSTSNLSICMILFDCCSFIPQFHPTILAPWFSFALFTAVHRWVVFYLKNKNKKNPPLSNRTIVETPKERKCPNIPVRKSRLVLDLVFHWSAIMHDTCVCSRVIIMLILGSVWPKMIMYYYGRW